MSNRPSFHLSPGSSCLRAARALFTWPVISGQLLSVSLALILSSCAPSPTQSDGSPQGNAEAQYASAWHTVAADYVDKTHHGQNWSRWRQRYQGQLLDADDAKVAIDTMLASLDDHYTRFLAKSAMKEQRLHINAKLFGVGMQIGVKEGRLLVIAPLEGTPADKAHLQPNDHISAINGTSSLGLSVQEAADQIRGPKGTPITLTIQRKGTQPFDLTLKRAEIPLQSVFTKELKEAPNLAYIRLASFLGETVPVEFIQTWEKLQDREGLILDLRGNSGGLLQNALLISDLFLGDKTVVSIDGRTAFQTQVLKAKEPQAITVPTVILVDKGSASASEIVASALQDNDRATLLGTTTFGKGLVQKVVTMPGGAGLNMTIARYRTPKGTDIHKQGVTPDVEVKLKWPTNPKEPLEDTQLNAAIAYLNALLTHH